MKFLERINIYQRISRWVDGLYDDKPIANISPQKLQGPWIEGYALDLHTLSTLVSEEDDFGKAMGWDQEYSNIGGHLNRYKYWKENRHVYPIAATASAFLKSKNDRWRLDMILPVPRSDPRLTRNPVDGLAKEIGKGCGLAVDYSALIKVKNTPMLKSIFSMEKRSAILQNAFDVFPERLEGKNILLVDDVYRSGATLTAICDAIKHKVKSVNIYVLTITKTRVNR